MPLKSYEDGIQEKLELEEVALRDKKTALAMFESMTREERVALWKSLVLRTQLIINTVGLASYRPYDGHYNAHSESKPVRLPEEGSSLPTVTFNISHEQKPGNIGYDDSGTRWLTVVKKFTSTSNPDVSTDGGNLSLGPRDCVEYPSTEIPNYLASLDQAELALNIKSS